MKFKSILLIFTFVMFGLINVSAQVWPFSSMIRFGNTVYYPIDSLKESEMTGTSIAFDKELTKRYFDLISIKDSIGFIINDSLVYFKQKQRKEPKCYKEIVFYNRRPFLNSNSKIKYLKLIDLNDTSLIAIATLKQKKGNGKSKKKELISLNKKDINGVFLGVGNTNRAFMSGLVTGICVMAIISTF